MTVDPTTPHLLAYASPALRRKPLLWPTFLLLLYLLLIPYALRYAFYYPTYYYFTAGDSVRTHATNYLALVRTPEYHLGMLFTLAFVNTLPLPVLLYFSRRPAATGLAIRKPSVSLLSCIIFMLGGVALSHIGSSILYDYRLQSPSLEHLAQLIRQAFQSDPWICLFIIGVSAPIAEELLFRGYIQSRLVRRFGPLLGIFFASIAFGAFHRDLYQGLYAFALGLFQGLVAYRAQSVVPAIFIHIAVNTTAVLIYFNVISANYHSLPVSMAACIVFPASLYLLLKLPSPLPGYLWARRKGQR